MSIVGKALDSPQKVKWKSTLRVKAEAELSRAPPSVAPPPAQTVENLIHELQVHKLELEMQNEELRQSHTALEHSRDRYLDLFEFAPVGYITVGRAGTVNETNLTGCNLLAIKRSKLINRRFSRFITPQETDRWHRLFIGMMEKTDREEQSFESVMIRDDGTSFYAHLDCQRRDETESQPALRIALVDISERKNAEIQLSKLFF